MTTLLQISDLHFGTEQPQVMQALLALSNEKKPDVLIVSGDITQRATPSQFSRAKTFCDSLGIIQMLSLPGNHDIPLYNLFSRLVYPYAAYQRAFGRLLEPKLMTTSLCLVTVNTTRWWRHKNGQISASQIARVCEQLSRATPQQLRVVVVHQPVHVLRPQDEHDRLRGWRPAVTAWSAAGADIVMGGHIHLPYVCELSTSISGLSRRLWCVQAGTAVSSRTRREAPNSVNVLEFTLEANGLHCSVERWDYQKAERESGPGQFVLAHTTALNPQRH